MNEITINDLLSKISQYNEEEVEFIKKAYLFAENLHKGQKRQSGDDYITHPLNVAYILANMHADRDTVCAGLLHDTLEDTHISKEEIAEQFNATIANLVDGVTKISKMNFSSKEEQNMANTRKIIVSITEDVRIIIIKLADRLHNMRTLQYKSEYKQKENSIETMEIFVPLAYYIGAYQIKNELEDLSFKYLKPDRYKRIEEDKKRIEKETHDVLLEMLYKIKICLDDRNIFNEIKIRTKNAYGIYKRLAEGEKISDIHDLLALKIMVNELEECYQTLGLVHGIYHPINDKFKDYICNPKTNMYRSLHTTVFGPKNYLVQTQIRTFDMEKIASYGLTAYWDINKGNARNVMQKELKDKYQFFKSLIEINKVFGDNQEFVRQVKEEVFSNKVYVYTSNGIIIELPKGSTIIDFAYKINPELANIMIGAYVNDGYVSVDYILNNKDRIRIITDNLSYGSREEWMDKAKTTYARRKIKEFNER